MTRSFPADAIDHEGPDPVEASSLRWINVPLVLLALFLGFGVAYLSLRTPDTALGAGDSRSPVTDSPALAVSVSVSGEKVYARNCQACHQATGTGVGTTFPPLDGSEWVVGNPETLAAIVLHGISGEITVGGTAFRGQMPPFKDQLTAEEIAAVASYVRGAWSNRADPVPAELVEKVKKETGERSGPFAGEAELPRP